MARFNPYTPPENEAELEKRKILAGELWRFIQDDSPPEYAEILVKEGEKIGISRKQLYNLYKQYKAGSEKSPTKLDGGSTFKQEEEEKRARLQASGAFGGDDWRGLSSANSVPTPNLDQYASDAFGARPMGSERRIITSPAGQMRLMARKADRAGININSLISANRGDVAAAFGELETAGFGAKGIRTQEEVRARPELASQLRSARADLLRRQEEEAIEAKEELKRKEKEQEEEEEEEEEEELAAKQGTSNPNATKLTDSSSGTANNNSKSLGDSSELANPNSRFTNPKRRTNPVG